MATMRRKSLLQNHFRRESDYSLQVCPGVWWDSTENFVHDEHWHVWRKMAEACRALQRPNCEARGWQHHVIEFFFFAVGRTGGLYKTDWTMRKSDHLNIIKQHLKPKSWSLGTDGSSEWAVASVTPANYLQSGLRTINEGISFIVHSLFLWLS